MSATNYNFLFIKTLPKSNFRKCNEGTFFDLSYQILQSLLQELRLAVFYVVLITEVAGSSPIMKYYEWNL
jgi:hypothetical protein